LQLILKYLVFLPPLKGAKMSKISEIKEELKNGDYVTIASITGFSRDYVKDVMNERGNRFNQNIIDAAEQLIAMRNALKVQFNPEMQQTS
jgi:hypothetical protein